MLADVSNAWGHCTHTRYELASEKTWDYKIYPIVPRYIQIHKWACIGDLWRDLGIIWDTLGGKVCVAFTFLRLLSCWMYRFSMGVILHGCTGCFPSYSQLKREVIPPHVTGVASDNLSPGLICTQVCLVFHSRSGTSENEWQLTDARWCFSHWEFPLDEVCWDFPPKTR